jgi:hypothetical protein
MSTGGTSTLSNRPRNVSMKQMLVVFAAIGVALYLVYTFSYSTDAFFLQNVSSQRHALDPPLRPTGAAANASDVTGVDATVSAVAVNHAVIDARLVQAREQLALARAYLERLKQKHPLWQTRSASLLGGDPGRRIAGSPAHVKLAVELFSQDPLDAAALGTWEQQIAALTAPLESGSQYVELTPDFINAIYDLGQRLTEATAKIDQQLQLLEALTQESSSLPLAQQTLEETLQNEKEKAARDEAERLAAVREKARREAEEEKAVRIAALEREVVAAESKREEEKLQAEKERIEQLTQAEKRQAAEEAKLREAQQRAVEAGLAAEATRVEEAIQEAQLEREFQRDLPQIKAYLIAFTADGFVRRESGKGPMSLAFLKGKGALDATDEGMRMMQLLATGTNDRPLGAMPEGTMVSGLPHLNRASELLRKYGDLMVKKKMLDP